MFYDFYIVFFWFQLYLCWNKYFVFYRFSDFVSRFNSTFNNYILFACSIYLRIYLSPCQALNYFLFLLYRIFPQVSKYSNCSIYTLLPPHVQRLQLFDTHIQTYDTTHTHRNTHVWFHRLKSAQTQLKFDILRFWLLIVRLRPIVWWQTMLL